MEHFLVIPCDTKQSSKINFDADIAMLSVI